MLLAQNQILHPNGWIFQEDNDPKHTSNGVKVSMQKQDMCKMDRPACSPDLNTIENLLAWIKMQLNLRAPKTLGGLEKDVNEIWKYFNRIFEGILEVREEKDSFGK